LKSVKVGGDVKARSIEGEGATLIVDLLLTIVPGPLQP